MDLTSGMLSPVLLKVDMTNEYHHKRKTRERIAFSPFNAERKDKTMHPMCSFWITAIACVYNCGKMTAFTKKILKTVLLFNILTTNTICYLTCLANIKRCQGCQANTSVNLFLLLGGGLKG
jgi:hypothetical protein